MDKKVGRRGFLGLLGIGVAVPVTKMLGVPLKRHCGQCDDGEPIKEKMELRYFYPEETSMKRNMRNTSVRIDFFCDRPAKRGQVGEWVPDEAKEQSDIGFQIVRPGQHGGYPMGVFMEDVVEVDLHKEHIQQEQVKIGGKVSLITDGWITVGPINGRKPEPGVPVFYDEQGNITTDELSIQIGVCIGTADEDGFAQVALKGYR